MARPAASRNLSGSPTLPPLPALLQGGVCGVETRTRREEKLYNREKPRRTSGDRDRQPEGSRETCKEHEGERGRHVRDGKDLGVPSKRRNSRQEGASRPGKSPGPSGASPRRPPPPPTAAEPERVKPREGALTPAPLPWGSQPKPEPGKATAEPKGPETTAPPSPPGRVGRQLGVGGKQVAGPSRAKLGSTGSRPSGRGRARPDAGVPRG